MQRNSCETAAGASKRNGIRAKPRWERRNQGPVPPRAPLRSATSVAPLQKRPEEATTGRNSCETTGGASKCNGIHAKPQREHRNATEFARNHGGSVEIKAPSHRARRCGRQPKWPPQKRPEEATRGRIRAKPQREHRNATEFARNRSGSIETQRNSCETTVGASIPRPRPTARAVAVGNLSGPPRRDLKRPREAEFARNHSGSAEMQRNSCETAAGASKRNGIRAKSRWERRNQGPIPPRAPLRSATPQRAPLRSTTSVAPLQKRPEEATTGRNSYETTGSASKCNGIHAKPQREHRNVTEFARNHSGSVETKAPSHRARRCGRQPK